jgi:hypothetical protein
MLGFHPIRTSWLKLVPPRHFYQQRRLTVNFRFVRPFFTLFYSEGGRPSLDPVAFIKLLLVGTGGE